MATVIHTRKGKYYYLYEHTREGDKVKSRYMHPVDEEGNKRIAQQVTHEQEKVAQQEANGYLTLKNEYERLRTLKKPMNETIEEMIERTEAINKARRDMNKADPWYAEKQKRQKKEFEEEKKRKEDIKKVYITPDNIRKNMIIERGGRLFEIVKVSRVNCYVLPYPSMPDIDKPEKVRIYDLSTYKIIR
jgi:hypothetical protein